ncbi:MAG: GlsB/YeaQ/YmgE family stress response membrane protein [Chloroflexota bacterium]|nr:GlsB/YeaQ/YmgE family stress response membrane protein [Chloroflexota bacterium]
MGILSWIVVGAIAGWLAGMLVRGDEGLGVIGKIVLGIIGAVVGGFVAGVVFPGSGDYINGINIQTIVVATIGAIIVVVGYHFLTGRSRTGRGAI